MLKCWNNNKITAKQLCSVYDVLSASKRDEIKKTESAQKYYKLCYMFLWAHNFRHCSGKMESLWLIIYIFMWFGACLVEHWIWLFFEIDARFVVDCVKISPNKCNSFFGIGFVQCLHRLTLTKLWNFQISKVIAPKLKCCIYLIHSSILGRKVCTLPSQLHASQNGNAINAYF